DGDDLIDHTLRRLGVLLCFRIRLALSFVLSLEDFLLFLDLLEEQRVLLRFTLALSGVTKTPLLLVNVAPQAHTLALVVERENVGRDVVVLTRKFAREFAEQFVHVRQFLLVAELVLE